MKKFKANAGTVPAIANSKNTNSGTVPAFAVPEFDRIFDKAAASKMIHEAVCLIENTSGDFSWIKGFGGKHENSPLLMASITKLFTTSCILALETDSKLSLDDKAVKYIHDEKFNNIHTYKGVNYTPELSIKDLLTQKSGLPDWYLNGNESFFKKVIKEDFSYDINDTLESSSRIKPVFPPNFRNKAYYTDMNFDILGIIIENITGLDLQNAYEKYIFSPLNLSKTYVARNDGDFVPAIYYKENKMQRDRFIKSCGASGGAVTTARELMTFLKAFWSQKFFDRNLLESKDTYGHSNLQISFFPIKYGLGYMKIDAGYPFTKKVELFGHSGSTGSFAFHSPQKDLFFVGDVNQCANPALPVRLLMNLAISSKKHL